MVYKLSLSEVQQVCNSCEQYVKDSESCRDNNGGVKTLKTLRRCPKWDAHYGSPCILQM
ncbi:hypothetical protein EDC14_102018 [Hydrogenispora ethanolica]|jgi:hypothetical protein|uniref:Uncharacterized protein n=1 Tax=Hydrogenispora ethanolica TaxID=1082276 RepID=A0A4R1RD26_HYDET|nr:hypothetical protein EDC14_102018 [Hydrogenispora ethanolica]